MREMKDSGIEWIGEIANTHKLVRLKYVAEILDEYRKPVTAQYRNQNADILYDYYGASGIIDKIDGYTIDDHVMLIGEDGANLKLRNLPLMYEVCGKAWINNHAHILKPMKNMDFYYLFYALEALDINNYITGSAQPKLNQENLKEILIPLPSYEVQKKVSSYLDTQCSEIDATAEDIQKEISLLEDYKKSVITEAVTKGLNPDVEMKDSGIEWIGEIPKDWEVHPVYVYFEEGKTKNYRMQEQNLLSLSYGRIIRKDINTNGGLLPASFNTYNVVEAGDIIIRPTDLQNDKRSLRTGLVKEQGIITSAYIDLRAKDNVNSKYYHYLLHSYDIIKVFYNMGNGVRQGLNFSEFAKLLLLEPTTVEQQQIADFLDTKCSEIDSLIADKKRQLDILADYKKSLIYEYVTGKKEVPVNE
ncbi:MAG: restriction endonuclease subunit S [Veillonellaceae bacterium]|nr:restriction endonuclease subunit S [Veillonellaceae bacterium]